MPLVPEIFGVIIDSLAHRFINRQCLSSEAGNGWLALFFRSGEPGLFISWKDPCSGFCTVSKSEVAKLKQAENNPFPFADIIEKHIPRSTLVEVKRIANDRIISFRFTRLIGAGINTSRTVIAELTGRKNRLYILRDDGSIIDSAGSINRDENLSGINRPGSQYIPPPPFCGVNLTNLCLPRLFFSLERLSGLGKDMGDRLKDNWHQFTLSSWFEYLKGMNDSSNSARNPVILVQSDDSVLSAFPIPIGNSTVVEEDILEFQRERIIIPLLAGSGRSLKQALLKKLEKRSLKLFSLKKGLENQIDQSVMASEYRKKGELLLSQSAPLPRGAESVTVPCWEGNSFTDIVIKLDPSISVSQNAQNYFRKYKKFNVDKTEIETKLRDLSIQESDLLFLEDILRTTEDQETIERISLEIGSREPKGQKRSTHGPVRIFEFCGHQIIAGTNSKSNRKVTFVFASGDDLWFHARGIPGGHVIIKYNPGIKDKIHIIEFAASLAAHFSKSGEAAKVDVDYTRRKYVRAVPGTVAEVTYSHARTVTVSPCLWERLLSEKQSAPGGGKTGIS